MNRPLQQHSSRCALSGMFVRSSFVLLPLFDAAMLPHVPNFRHHSATSPGALCPSPHPALGMMCADPRAVSADLSQVQVDLCRQATIRRESSLWNQLFANNNKFTKRVYSYPSNSVQYRLLPNIIISELEKQDLNPGTPKLARSPITEFGSSASKQTKLKKDRLASVQSSIFPSRG